MRPQARTRSRSRIRLQRWPVAALKHSATRARTRTAHPTQSPGCGTQPNTRANSLATSTVAASGNSKPIVILRITQVMARTGVKRSTIYDWLNPEDPRYRPHFPRQVKLGASAVGWVESEIDAFLETLVDEASAGCADQRIGGLT